MDTRQQHLTDPTWKTVYAAERKKSRILGASTIAASLLAVGAGAWGLSNTGSTTSTMPGQFGGPGTSQMAPPTGQAPPGVAGNLAATLFNDDGSVNAEALEQFAANAPGGNISAFLEFAVNNGELSQDQADSLAAALSDSQSQDT